MFVALPIAFFLLFCSVHACFSAWIATQKNRSGLNWLFLGFFFGPLAICALIAVPSLRSEQKPASSPKKVEGKHVEALVYAYEQGISVEELKEKVESGEIQAKMYGEWILVPEEDS